MLIKKKTWKVPKKFPQKNLKQKKLGEKEG
jgi:hypothetical protein